MFGKLGVRGAELVGDLFEAGFYGGGWFLFGFKEFDPAAFLFLEFADLVEQGFRFVLFFLRNSNA